MYVITDKTGFVLCKLDTLEYETPKHLIIGNRKVIQVDRVNIYEAQVSEDKPYYYDGKFRNVDPGTSSNRKLEIQAELDKLDRMLTRGEEDLIDLLISKSLLTENDVTGYLKSRKQQKKALRLELADL